MRLWHLYVAVASLSLAVGLWWLFRPTTTHRTAVTASKSGISDGAAGALLGPAPAGGILDGTIRSDEGPPIDRALVCMTSLATASEEPVTRCTATDVAGRFAFVPIAEGRYTIGAQAAGFKPGWAFDGRPLTIRSNDERHGIALVLAHGGVALTGLVVDAIGGPVPGAVIRAAVATRLATVAIAGEDGRFTCWLEPGMADVVADAAGYATARAMHIAPSRDLVLTMMPASKIEGLVVTDADGGSVAGLDVHANGVPGRALVATERVGKSGEDGAFVIAGLAPGTYELVAEGEGWRGSMGPIRLQLADVAKVRVVVSPAAMVTGDVMLHESQGPCPAGRVSLGSRGSRFSGASTGTDDRGPDDVDRSVPFLTSTITQDGGVRFPAVPAGDYRVSVQCLSHVLLSGPSFVEVGQNNVGPLRWEVVPNSHLLVHVVDASGRPVASARVRVYWPPRGGYRPVSDLTADVEGKAESADGINPGTYTVAPGPGYEGSPTSIDVIDGSGDLDVTLHLAGQGAIEVTVQDTSGAAIDAVRVQAERDPAARGPTHADSGLVDAPSLDDELVQAIPIGNGRFHLGPLSAGRYRVDVGDAVNEKLDRGTFVNVHGDRVETTIVIDRSGRIAGQVLDEHLQPVPDAWVRAHCRASQRNETSGWHSSAGGSAASVLTDGTGHFSISSLAETTVCSLQAEAPDGTVATKQDVPVDDEKVMIVVPGGGAIGGVATAADGRTVHEFRLWMMDAQSGVTRSEVLTATDGRWALARVTPGHWRLHAFRGGQAADQEFDLEPGQTLNNLDLRFGAQQNVRATR